MKIPALLTLLLAAVLSALPLSHARADDVSFDVFYNNLTDQGAWYNTPDFGYVWQPNVGYQNDKWRPYTDGYWAQTDNGWTWVSYENFGWATYHYGRWTNLEGIGWAWVPGYEWGPGWVSWRTSDDYVGWAPLPPARHEVSNGGGAALSVDYNTVEPESGYYGAVDQTYDIGPANYCFVETRSFGAPVLREVILPPQRNIIIVENTVNVTNIVYNRGGPRVIVYNGGPDFAFINGRVDRPIQRLRIEQNNNFDFVHGPRDHNPNLVRDGVFQVAAPTIARRPVNFAELRPPAVKRDLPAPRVEHGWSNTGGDPAAIQRVRQQFQQQARQLPPRPPGNPAAAFVPPADPRGRDARTTVPPAPAATPVVRNPPPRGNTDADRQARRDAALRDKEARDAEANGGQPRPAATPGGQPFNPPAHPPRPVPNNPEVTRGPAVPPTPVHEANPTHDPRNHHPANTPANTPEATPRAEVPPHHPVSEPTVATPNAAVEEETRHTPRPSEHTPPPAPPARNAETENERHAPAHTPEHTPPPAPRQEVHEPRPTTQTPPPAPKQEVHEPREVHENHPKPPASPVNGNDDRKHE